MPGVKGMRSSSRSIRTGRCARSKDRPDRSTRSRTRRSSGGAACVDAVVVFDEDNPQEIISRLQPDVLVKGADWAADAIIGRETVEARGGRVVRIPLAEGLLNVGDN